MTALLKGFVINEFTSSRAVAPVASDVLGATR